VIVTERDCYLVLAKYTSAVTSVRAVNFGLSQQNNARGGARLFGVIFLADHLIERHEGFPQRLLIISSLELCL